MLYRHVLDKISTEFRGISRVFVNFAALLLLEISEALYLWAASFTLYKLATKNLHLATIFLRLVATRRPEDFFNFEPWGHRQLPRQFWATWKMAFYLTMVLYALSLSYPNTLMLVSKTETTTSLSNETSLITSLTAFSNSSISQRT